MFPATLLLVGIVGVAGSTTTPTTTSDAASGSPAPTMPATSVMVGDPNCKDDNLTTCSSYEHASCTGPYEDWARVHCAASCGFCIPITSPFDCVDTNPLCSSMNSDLCTNSLYTGFVRSNCLKFCDWCPGGVTTTKMPKTGCYDDFENCGEFGRKTCVGYPEWSDIYCKKYCGFCTSNTTDATNPMSTTTTPAPTPSHAPGDCYDRLDCSGYNIHTSCCGSYESWARWNCAATCKFCKPKNTTPRMCTDNSPICSQYNKDLCTNPIYSHFAVTECAGFCKICLVPEYTPPCAVDANTTTTPVSTSVVVERGCTQDGVFHREGDGWDSLDCVNTYQCVDAASNNITSRPLRCVREVPKHCYFVLKIGACCPLIRCEYPNIIHGERTQEHGYILG
ncbi:uncharacterized protein LOC124275652 [Haliotis rubra]|uniref:uncharacterized protein LOC124275652 n=1 Tax=Haliotis rubra TaxID=36100 RepID=UPI001EE559C8|nr:uncharacterized protein LOC124275652 [Haliotis rubra]